MKLSDETSRERSGWHGLDGGEENGGSEAKTSVGCTLTDQGSQMDARFPYIPRFRSDKMGRWKCAVGSAWERAIRWKEGYRGIYTVMDNLLFMTVFTLTQREIHRAWIRREFARNFCRELSYTVACNRCDAIACRFNPVPSCTKIGAKRLPRASSGSS